MVPPSHSPDDAGAADKPQHQTRGNESFDMPMFEEAGINPKPITDILPSLGAIEAMGDSVSLPAPKAPAAGVKPAPSSAGKPSAPMPPPMPPYGGAGALPGIPAQPAGGKSMVLQGSALQNIMHGGGGDEPIPPPTPASKPPLKPAVPSRPPSLSTTRAAAPPGKKMPTFEFSGVDVATGEDLNVGIDKVLDLIGVSKSAITEDGQNMRLFCPIHREQIRRSLVVDKDAKTFKCQFRGCPGHVGGTLTELVAGILEIGVREARSRLLYATETLRMPQHSLVHEAQEAIEKLNYAKALPLLKEAVEAAPKDEVTRCRLASLQLEVGDREGGIQNYLIAAEDYGIRGDLGKTLHIFKLLVLIDPKDLNLHEQMAYISARLGDTAEAVSRLSWVVDQLIQAERVDDAIQRVDKLLELRPGAVDFICLKAELHMAQGLPQRATELLAFSIQEKVLAGELVDALRLADKGAELTPSNLLMSALRDEVSSALAKKGQDADSITKSFKGLKDESAEAAEEEEFRGWIGELESEIEPFREAEEHFHQTGEIAAPDERILFCKQNLEGFDQEKLERMWDHLKVMYKEMKEQAEEGSLSPEEQMAIGEFYKSFCIAYIEHTKGVEAAARAREEMG